MKVSEFMIKLHNDLIEKKKVKENTANTYLRNLYIVNRNQPFNNLAFLKKYGNVDIAIAPYSLNSKKNIIIAITSVLSLYKDKNSYKKAHSYWNGILHNINKELEETRNKMNVKEKNNYMKWEDILKIKEDLKKKVEHFEDNKAISHRQFATLKKYVVLSLYTDIPPRRNRDYQECYIVYGDKHMTPDRNYYDIKDNKFVFNQYKTSKTYGKQEIDISDNRELVKTLNLWYKFHPLTKDRYTKNLNVRLLVNYDGSPLKSVNSITRILYSIFGGKKIGSSMLRHIYLTDKYKDEMGEMRRDAEMMGHSQSQQKEYVFEDVNESIED